MSYGSKFDALLNDPRCRVARHRHTGNGVPGSGDECYDVHGMDTMHDILELGSAVRAARTRAGMTQSALAAACKLSRQTVAQLEAGSFSDLGIRKIERVLAHLGLRLRVAALVPTLAPAPGKSRLGHLLHARGEARRQLAVRMAATALRRLKNAGVTAGIVGSLARGAFRPDSDVDFLIEQRGGLSESRITDLVASAMQGFPFDVVFAERVDPSLLRFLRAEAQRGAPVIRAA
jgi:transcriptional regulator with XRE-family HTH domain